MTFPATRSWSRSAGTIARGVAIVGLSLQRGPVPIAVDVPLTDDEFDVLEERGLDVHYALGVLHAVGSRRA